MTKITYSMTGELNRSFDEDYTVGQLLSDRMILGAINAPEGCVATSGGRTLASDEYVVDFSVITLEKRSASKAS